MRRALLATLALAAAGVAPALAHFPMLLLVDDEGRRVGPVFVEGQWVTCDFTVGHPFVDDRFAAGRPTRVEVLRPTGDRRDVTASVTTTAVTFRGVEFEAHRLRWRLPPGKTGDFVLAWQLPMLTEKPHRQVLDFAKIVVHVPGEQQPGSQVGWWQRAGHPLEILPLSRPYWVPVGQAFRGQVIEDGRPMAGGVVEAETWADAVPDPMPELAAFRRAERTDPTGCFAVTLDRAGWWLLSVATDGGPGEQGTMPAGHAVRRAVMWVFVGEPPAQARYPLADYDRAQGNPPRPGQ